MLFSKRGQAAVEYLVTYGWAFLAILATVGVMSYFGLLNPSKYIPDSCEFGEQLSCQDHYIDDSPIITLRFENNFEDDITITNVTGEDITYSGGPIDIGLGQIKRIDIGTTRPLFEGDKETFDIIIEFQRNDGSPNPHPTPYHNVSGRIFGEVQPSALGLLS
ncbi:MAG: hypothetical protein KC535_04925 [Nanoarchaeota archaeon]|nr:hypothetical protein [Nanoarchaeota archaeon]